MSCSACCYDNPHGVTAFELLYIYEMIKDRSSFSEVREQLGQRYKDFQNLRKEKGRSNLQINWKKKRNPCVFLDEKQQCSIYERRPVACRMFFSLTSPEFCEPTHPEFESAINPHLEPSSAIKDLLKKISYEQNIADVPKDLISGMYQMIKKMEQRHSD